MILPESNRVVLLAVRYLHPSFILELINKGGIDLILFLETTVSIRMGCLSRIEVFEVNDQDGGGVLFKTIEDLSEVNGTGYRHCPVVVILHSVDISVVADAVHMLRLGLVSIKAHTLIPSVSNCHLSSNN